VIRALRSVSGAPAWEKKMPIQEALVWQRSQIARPGGVLFDPECKSKAQDIAAWNELIPHMRREIAADRYVMALIQTRNTRAWSANDMQYAFKPAEDYLVAAYLVSSSIGNPYAPSTIAHAWLNRVLATQSGRTLGINQDHIHMFQCSAQGCNLTTVGLTRLISFHEKGGKTHSQAISLAQSAIVDGQKYGWRGGAFPGIGMASAPSPDPGPAPTGRGRSGAIGSGDPFAGF